MVTYAVKQKMKNGADYWDYATLLELAILDNNQVKAEELLPDVLVNVRESFEPKTTANNLAIIVGRRSKKGNDVLWIEEIVNKLLSL